MNAEGTFKNGYFQIYQSIFEKVGRFLKNGGKEVPGALMTSHSVGGLGGGCVQSEAECTCSIHLWMHWNYLGLASKISERI